MDSGAQLWFKRTCVVCFVTCLFVFLCCVYCTILLHQITLISKECSQQTSVYQHEALDRPKTELKDVFQEGSRRGLNKAKEMRFVRSTDNRKKPKPKKRRQKLRAGHYQSMVTKSYLGQAFPSYADETCFHIAEMAGTLCRTKDYVTNNTQNAIRAFEPASWVSDKMAPFTVKEQGFFTARSKGIHLIYAQVLFYDNKEAQIIRLVQLRRDKHGNKEIQSLTCHESVDKSGPVRYHSCGIIGLFSLEKRDVIYLQNVFADVKLNLRLSTTYIGAILLK